MSYFKPYIDETGYHYPTYNEILEQLIDDFQTVYGAGAYLGSDSQDYEFLSKVAEKIFDCYQSNEIVYNSFSPDKAIGTGLDYIVAINGIVRKQATKSVVTLTLSGEPGTVIANGAVSDANGYMWDLPSPVVLGDTGDASVEAVCRETGTIQAAPGTVTHIMTPVAGWESVTNESAATVGTVTETDSELRGRRAESVALPSQSLLDGLRGALGAITGVNRKEVYENKTNVTNDFGIPPHSICCVVEGGTDQDIGNTIFLRKGDGCGTYGTQTVEVTDSYGQLHDVSFFRLSYVDIDIEINISRRTGYKASTPDEIKGAIIDYLDTFSIGTDLTVSIIWMVAQQINADARTPTFSIQSVRTARHGLDLSFDDVLIDFNEVAKGREQLITVNVLD